MFKKKIELFLFDNFIAGFFTDTVQARFFNLCMIITLFGVYQFIPGLMILTLFQGHRFVKIIKSNFLIFIFLDSCQLWFKQCIVLAYMREIKDSMLCVTGVYLDITNPIFFNYALECELSECLSFCLLFGPAYTSWSTMSFATKLVVLIFGCMYEQQIKLKLDSR